jgi:hypothetical protein
MSRFRLPLLFASTLLLGGCLTPGMGGLSMNATISGGSTVRIDFDGKGVVHAENDDIRIDSAVLVPDFKAKKVAYTFSFHLKHAHVEAPRSVKVDDVTDDVAVNWINDEHPTLNAKGGWEGKVAAMDPDRIPWLIEIESAIRVYRFTIVTADGRTVLLYEGASYPAPIKKFFREQLGLEKIDKH